MHVCVFVGICVCVYTCVYVCVYLSPTLYLWMLDEQHHSISHGCAGGLSASKEEVEDSGDEIIIEELCGGKVFLLRQ